MLIKYFFFLLKKDLPEVIGIVSQLLSKKTVCQRGYYEDEEETGNKQQEQIEQEDQENIEDIDEEEMEMELMESTCDLLIETARACREMIEPYYKSLYPLVLKYAVILNMFLKSRKNLNFFLFK